MTRYNIFNQIHKGLRALLYDTALTLQQTNFGDAEEAETALDKVRIAVDIFDQHALHEDEHVLTAVQRYEPSIVDMFEQEHVKDHALSEALRGLLKVYGYAMQAGVKIETGQSINKAFIEFMVFNLEHMAREEVLLNKILWRYYTDAEIVSINQRIVQSISPQEMAATSRWMMRGLSAAEISHWLKEIERNAPAHVFAQFLAMAEKELSHQRFTKVSESLTEGAQVA
ncbi:MAG: hypothetical protein EOO02_07300 [Chitinophagaceae bacterium]|nr:MAG: hypothetical protein EOO02_07300 [Chitinophagaceae bacterium]